MKLSEIKRELRNGPYAWPGGYPKFFIMIDGGVLSYQAVKQNWREICFSHVRKIRDSWMIAGVAINWEDNQLFCDHTGERIESAYGED